MNGGSAPARRACLGSRHSGGSVGLPVSRPAADPHQERAPPSNVGGRGPGRGDMIRENPNTIQSEVNEAQPHPEAADHHIDVRQDEWPDDAARPVSYLWPTLMSLWRGN